MRSGTNTTLQLQEEIGLKIKMAEAELAFLEQRELAIRRQLVVFDQNVQISNLNIKISHLKREYKLLRKDKTDDYGDSIIPKLFLALSHIDNIKYNALSESKGALLMLQLKVIEAEAAHLAQRRIADSNRCVIQHQIQELMNLEYQVSQLEKDTAALRITKAPVAVNATTLNGIHSSDSRVNKEQNISNPESASSSKKAVAEKNPNLLVHGSKEAKKQWQKHIELHTWLRCQHNASLSTSTRPMRGHETTPSPSLAPSKKGPRA